MIKRSEVVPEMVTLRPGSIVQRARMAGLAFQSTNRRQGVQAFRHVIQTLEGL